MYGLISSHAPFDSNLVRRVTRLCAAKPTLASQANLDQMGNHFSAIPYQRSLKHQVKRSSVGHVALASPFVWPSDDSTCAIYSPGLRNAHTQGELLLSLFPRSRR